MGDLFDSTVPVPGNLAKVHCLLAIERALQERSDARVLDVGCIGPQPLEFWRALMERYHGRFTLHGTDVAGIERGRVLARQNGWENVVLHELSGYSLTEAFSPDSFDLVVATQVLEHMRRWPRFLTQARAILKSGGQLLITFDSGDSQRPAGLGRRCKEPVKRLLVLLAGRERYWDVGVSKGELLAASTRVGLEVVEHRYFNIHPLKHIHNHVLEPERRNAFLRRWYALESFMNEAGDATRTAGYFQTQFCALRKTGADTAGAGGPADAAADRLGRP